MDYAVAMAVTKHQKLGAVDGSHGKDHFLAIPNPTNEMLPTNPPTTIATTLSRMFHAIVNYSRRRPRCAMTSRPVAKSGISEAYLSIPFHSDIRLATPGGGIAFPWQTNSSWSTSPAGVILCTSQTESVRRCLKLDWYAYAALSDIAWPDIAWPACFRH